MSLLVLIRGIPGSGKSTLASRIRDALDGQVVLLDPDEVDQCHPAFLSFSRKLEDAGVSQSIHLFRFLRERARAALSRGGVVIWNQPFTNEAIFRGLLRWMGELPTPPQVVVIQLRVSVALALKRVKEREERGGRGLTYEQFAAYIADYHEFHDLDGPVVAWERGDSVFELVDLLSAFLIEGEERIA